MRSLMHLSQLKLCGQLVFTANHTWGQATSENTVKIGVSEFFIERVGDIVRIEIDEVGEAVQIDVPFGIFETWWFGYDLYSPLNGEIVRINRKIIDSPIMLKAFPYEWIAEILPSRLEAEIWMNNLLNSEEYIDSVNQVKDPMYKFTTNLLPKHMFHNQTRTHEDGDKRAFL